MQLKLQRSQRPGGALGRTVIFCLDARADYSPAEAANIGKYKLGGQLVYSSQAARRHVANAQRHLDRVDSELLREKTAGIGRGLVSLALAKLSLNVSIASLGRGHHIQCKDLGELLDAERALMDACRNVKQFLEAAATFNGSVILVDFDDGEKVHLSQGVLELAALPPPSTEAEPGDEAPTTPRRVFSNQFLEDIRRGLDALYRNHTKLIWIAGALLGGLLILSVFGTGFWSLLAAALLVAGTVTWALRRY